MKLQLVIVFVLCFLSGYANTGAINRTSDNEVSDLNQLRLEMADGQKLNFSNFSMKFGLGAFQLVSDQNYASFRVCPSVLQGVQASSGQIFSKLNFNRKRTQAEFHRTIRKKKLLVHLPSHIATTALDFHSFKHLSNHSHKFTLFHFKFLKRDSLLTRMKAQVKRILNGVGQKQSVVDLSSKIKLSDLNMDCMLTILDELDFVDLLGIAQVNKYFSILAAEVFRSKFSSNTIVLYNFVYEDERNSDGIYFKSFERLCIVKREKVHRITMVHDGQIQITDFQTGLKTLKYFGNAIQKLNIYTDDTDTEQSKILSRFLNEYCSESLIELWLDIIKGSAPLFMPKSFNKLTHITFGGFLPKMGRKTPPSNQTFPALTALTLNLNDKGSDYLNSHFPHLKQLNIMKLKRIDDINNLLAANSHIRCVSYHQKSPRSLKMISAILPKLENLTLWSFNLDDDDDEIHFENVERFTMKDFFGSPKNLHFPKLREAHIPIGAYFDDSINFLREHKQLNRIELEFSNLNDTQFEKVTENLPNLVEISACSTGTNSIGIDTIVTFLENHNELMRFDLGNCRNNDKEILQEKLGNKWDFTDSRHGISLTRNDQKNKKNKLK